MVWFADYSVMNIAVSSLFLRIGIISMTMIIKYHPDSSLDNYSLLNDGKGIILEVLIMTNYQLSQRFICSTVIL